jgi:rod shape-determining protein MreD
VTASRLAAAVAGLLTALLLQATLVGPLTFPVPVSLPALLVVVTGIYAGPGIGLSFGFCTGLLADLGSQDTVGVQALTLLAAGLAAGVLGGLATERGYRTRGVAAMAAGLATATALATGLLLVILGSHGASPATVFDTLIPVLPTDALLGLLLVPAVRAVLRSQGIRAARPRTSIVSRVPDVG